MKYRPQEAPVPITSRFKLYLTGWHFFDTLAAIGIFSALLVLHYRLLFERLEWDDWVAYALPAANWVTRGTLNLPQLGTQYHFDRHWLFSAPWMGLGPVPWFLTFGVGRTSYLMGTLAIAVTNLLFLPYVFRRALQLRSLTVSILITNAWLGHATYLSSLHNQRYDLLAYSILALLFIPRTEKTASWKWLLAGCLPLIHISLSLACFSWCMLAGFTLFLSPHQTEVKRSRIWTITLCLMAGLVTSVLWYGRWDAVQTQLIPHLQAHLRHEGFQYPGIGWYAGPLSYQSILGRIVFAIPLLLSVFTILNSFRICNQGSPLPLLASALFCAVVCWDALRGFIYLAFYAFGLAPILLSEVTRSTWRHTLIGLFAVLGLVHLTMNFSLAPQWPYLFTVEIQSRQPFIAQHVSQRSVLEFIVSHTQPNDRIVVGPPFILSSAERHLAGNRRIVAVTPQPFYLDDFDSHLFRTSLRQQAHVYLGTPDFFQRTQSWNKGKPDLRQPLFENGTIVKRSFFGTTVLIVRVSAPRPSGSQREK